MQDGQVILRTDSANLVLTGGAGNTVDLTLVPPAQPEAAAAESGQAALAGTWTLEDIGGARAAAGVESYVSLTAEGEVLGRGGCNGFRGSYSLDGEALTLGPLAATRRACPPPQMQQETRFLAALEATRGFRIEDGRLVLVDALGDPVARLVREE